MSGIMDDATIVSVPTIPENKTSSWVCTQTSWKALPAAKPAAAPGHGGDGAYPALVVFLRIGLGFGFSLRSARIYGGASVEIPSTSEPENHGVGAMGSGCGESRGIDGPAENPRSIHIRVGSLRVLKGHGKALSLLFGEGVRCGQ
jgi:hypothetical protein